MVPRFNMILKQTPEDFQVEELTNLQPSEGPFCLYRLEKSGWTTPDALQAIRRRWQLDQRRLSYGGLKDRHARTIQHFTVFHGPQRRLTHQGFTVAYLGRVAQPFVAENICANRFRMVVRDVSKDEGFAFTQAIEEIRAWGVPNYFDDQRFGSVHDSGERRSDSPPVSSETSPLFVAKAIILGRYEEALRLALTAYYPHDRGPQKKEKAVLREHWGDWAKCKSLLPRGHPRSLVDYLVGHPEDFRGTLARLRPELRGLYLSAYQSHLWNRILAVWLKAHLRPEQLVFAQLKLGEVPMHRALDESELENLRHLRLPLPSHRVEWQDDDPRKPFLDQVLQEENLTLDQFKLKGFKEMFFSRGERAALCLPANLAQTKEPDDTHPGRHKMTLTLELPRGSYATLLVKRMSSA
jgi:tRNA pseudouridine13 synthase